MKQEIELMFFSDPGHGWLRVQKPLLDMLGIKGKISLYSYMDDLWAYLEEDCDLSTFISACKAKEIGVKILDSEEDGGFIRSKESFS